MSTQQVLRAWRDHDYWLSLSETERARVPENPAGLVELMDAELEHVAGGDHTQYPHHTCFTCEQSCFGTCNQCTDGTVQPDPCCY